MKAYAFALLLGFATPSHAGVELGNGGDVIHCKHKNSYQVLDLYELETINGFKRGLGKKHLGPIEKVEIALERLSKLSPLRAKTYREQLATFFSESRMLENVDLKDIDDSKHIALPKGCEVKQAVIQKKNPKYFEPRYIFDKMIWDGLDNDNKAVLILHELIYRETSSHGHKNSIMARYLTTLIASKKLKTLGQWELAKILSSKEAGPFHNIEYLGLVIKKFDMDPRRLAFYTELDSGSPVGCGTIEVGLHTFCKSRFHFYPSGKIYALYMHKYEKITINGVEYELDGEDPRRPRGKKPSIYFHENGRIRSIYVTGKTHRDGQVCFDTSGQKKRCP